MKIDLVFSGGGVKAFAFLGALESIKIKNYKIERVAGTSAGAIISSFLATNHSLEEIEDIFKELDLKKFLDPPLLNKRIPFIKWISLYFNMGLYKGDVFEKWLEEKFAKKGFHTFADVKEGYLKIIVSDISLGRLIILPDDLQPTYGINPNTFKIASAVRMSASFPYFFYPKKIKNIEDKKSIMIDGGLLSNFPLWVFDNKKKSKRPVLGLTLSESFEENEPSKVNNALDMLQALLNTMLRAHDARYISKSKQQNIVFIPVKKVKATDLKLNDEQKRALVELGKERTEQFLNNWP